MSEDVSAAIERVCELPVLAPDAEADACGPAFEAWARDRMDEWHAAIAAHDGGSIDGLERDVVLVRSAAELCALAASRPAGARTLALCEQVERERAQGARAGDAAVIRALRDRWEPAFYRSIAWQNAVGLLWPLAPVPWVALGCREVLRVARGEALDRASLYAPWLAMFGRGCWPMALGEGAVGLWVPRADEGTDGVERAIRATPERAFAVSPLRRLGLREPSCYLGPGGMGIEYFGPDQSAGLDSARPTIVRWRNPEMAPNPPGPNVYPPPPIVMPTMNLPTPRPVIAPPQSAPEPSKELSALDRLRRWFKK